MIRILLPSEISSAAVVVNGLTVAAAPAPTSGNIVILAEYNSKFYAMTNSLTSGALAGVEVEKDGSKIVVSSAEDKAAIQWTATVDGDNTTLKDAENNYIKGSSGASLSLDAAPYITGIGMTRSRAILALLIPTAVSSLAIPVMYSRVTH